MNCLTQYYFKLVVFNFCVDRERECVFMCVRVMGVALIASTKYTLVNQTNISVLVH